MTSLRRWLWAWGVALLAGLTWVTTATAAPLEGAQPASKRVAVLIGNTAYRSLPQLENAGRDVGLVGAALRSIGFEVKIYRDANAAQLRGALSDFTQASRDADVALIYYAGFGLETGGEGWLLPTDIQIRSVSDLAIQGIRRTDALGAFSQAKTRIAVFDASRDDPFDGGSRGFYLPSVNPPGVTILYSTGDGGVAKDGPAGAPSPFAQAFARRIVQKGIGLDAALRLVADDVQAVSQGEQKPEIYAAATARELFLAGPSPKAMTESTASLAQQPRLALVIGIGDYNRDGKITERSTQPGYLRDLRNPVGDAEAMTQALKDLNFTVTQTLDASKDDLIATIVAFGEDIRSAGPDAIVVVYFAGHGVQLYGRNFLFPAGARAPRKGLRAEDLELVLGGTAIELTDIFNRLQMPNALGGNVIILDACRDNVWQHDDSGGSAREGRKGITDQRPPLRRTLVAYATESGHVAEDGTGQHSPFTQAILDRIRQPDLTVHQLFEQVINAVDVVTDGKQLPHTSASAMGELCLGLCRQSDLAGTGAQH